MGNVIKEHLTRNRFYRHRSVLPGSGTQKPGRNGRLRIIGVQFVAGELFADEGVVRFVGIETADYIVAVTPGIGALEVVRVPAGIGIADYVQPVSSPPFAITGRG